MMDGHCIGTKNYVRPFL